jgi:hypothetical protein
MLVKSLQLMRRVGTLAEHLSMQGENPIHIRQLDMSFGAVPVRGSWRSSVESPMLLDVEDLIGQQPQNDWL